MFPLLQLGPLAVPVSPLLILLSIWLGLSVSEKYSEKFHIHQEQLYNLVFVGLIAGVVGARLAYALKFPGVFLENPLALLTIRPVMLDGQSGLMIGLAAAFVFQQNRKMPFWRTLDALTCGLAIFFVALGLAHFASGDAFGSPAQLPWSIALWGENRHPTQFYETMGSLLILWAVHRRISSSHIQADGILFLTFVAYTSGLHLFLETFRGDSIFIFGRFRTAQILYWVILALSLWMLNSKSDQPEEKPLVLAKE